jgi:hypothetical protein
VLSGHVGLPLIKETDFFSKHFDRGIDWYLASFVNCPTDRPMGEIDPNYFGIVQACERIAKLIPACKIVVSLRDPTDRAWSGYRVMRRDAWTRVGFEQTVAQNDVIRDSSRYAFHLGNWQRLFGADRVLVMLYDELEADPQLYLDRICDFIGAPHLAVPSTVGRVNSVVEAPRSRRLAQNARNARDWLLINRWARTVRTLDRIGVWDLMLGGGEKFGAMDPEVEIRLRAHFLPEVEALESILDRDLSAWKYPRPRAT